MVNVDPFPSSESNHIFPFIPYIDSTSLLGYLIILFIVLKYPELVLISYSQIIRAHYMYKQVLGNEVNRKSKSLKSVIAYIEELPEEIKKRISKEKALFA